MTLDEIRAAQQRLEETDLQNGTYERTAQHFNMECDHAVASYEIAAGLERLRVAVEGLTEVVAVRLLALQAQAQGTTLPAAAPTPTYATLTNTDITEIKSLIAHSTLLRKTTKKPPQSSE